MFHLFHLAAHDLSLILSHFGYPAVFAFIMIESLGIPFPGESMLITASIYTGTTHHLNIYLVIISAAAGAITGDSMGFWIGKKGGYYLLRHYGRYLGITEGRLKVGQYLFFKYGPYVVFFGRFVSLLRTWAAFLAGTNNMRWRNFLLFNAAGGILWATLYGTLGYLLGEELRQLGTVIRIVTFSLGMLIFLLVTVYLRYHEKQLEKEAQKEMPGPVTQLR